MKTLRMAIVLILVSATASAEEPTYKFDWDTLLAASIKLQKDFNYRANVDSYLRLFEPDVWDFVRNDEFELDAQRKKTIEKFQAEIERFSLDQPVALNTWLTIGQYNFETKSFPVMNMTEGHHWYKRRYSSGSFPREFRMYLSNHALLAEIPMSPDEARAFLNRRKDRNGEVNRRIEVTLRIRLTELKRRTQSDLLGEIQSARLFHNRQQKHVFKDIVKPVEKKKVAEETQKSIVSTPDQGPGRDVSVE